MTVCVLVLGDNVWVLSDCVRFDVVRLCVFWCWVTVCVLVFGDCVFWC